MMFFYSNVPKLKRISVAHAAPEIISVCRLNLMSKPLYVFHANNCCLSFFQPDLTFKIHRFYISNSAFHILLFYSHSMVAGGLELMS